MLVTKQTGVGSTMIATNNFLCNDGHPYCLVKFVNSLYFIRKFCKNGDIV